jgi:hypothetical protein
MDIAIGKLLSPPTCIRSTAGPGGNPAGVWNVI